MNNKALYTFNWNEGGYNQVYAYSKQQAIKRGNYIGKHCLTSLTVNVATIKRIPKDKEDANYRSICID